MEKAIVKIGEKEYELKFTIGFWKKIKEVSDVTADNLEEKLREDFGNVATQIVHWGAFYANPGDEPSIEDIENSLDRSVMDAIEQAVINGMTKAELELLELAKKKRAAGIKDLEESIEGKDDDSKK